MKGKKKKNDLTSYSLEEKRGESQTHDGKFVPENSAHYQPEI